MTYPLVEISWDDAATSHGWEAAEDLETEAEIATTIGFLVKETSDHVVIASTIDANGNNNGRIQIPKRMIRKRRVIRKPK